MTIVDTEPAVVALLDSLANLPTQPPSLYLDIEGVNLSRHGSISILQLLVSPRKQIFLIDVFALKEAAFNTPNRSGTNLRSILESADVPKVFFDVRNDSDALFSLFHVSMRGIQDVQLLEVATRSFSKDKVVGLAACITKDAQLTRKACAAWKATKDKGRSRFSPERGGSYEVLNVRPMQQDIVDYCTQDVVYLPLLWKVYTGKISPKWMRKVQVETCERIVASQKASYEPHGRDKTLSPWVKAAKSEQGKSLDTKEAKSQEEKSVTTVAQTAAIEAPKKTMATRPKSTAESQAAAGSQDPASLAALIAAQKAPEINAELQGSLPKLDLAIRSKAKLEPVSKKKTSSTLHPATVHPMWTCTTCDREMQELQKEDHIAGKQHIARAKQTAPPQPRAAKQKTLRATTAVTMTLAAEAKSPATNPETTAAASKKGKKKQAAVPQSYQQKGLPYPSDHLFLGFHEMAGPRNHGYETSWSLENLDYSICDSDCGWCGHCMDGVDF